MLGTVVAAAALTVLVYEKTGSPALAALTFSAAFLPYLLSGTLLASVVDRLPARRVLVACSLTPSVSRDAQQERPASGLDEAQSRSGTAARSSAAPRSVGSANQASGRIDRTSVDPSVSRPVR